MAVPSPPPSSHLSNINFQLPSQYKVVVDRRRLKNLEFFLQGVSLPSLSLTAAELPFSQTHAFVPGDRIEYGDLSLSIILDETLNTYAEIHNWIHRIAEHATSPADTHFDGHPYYHDLSIVVLTSDNKIARTVRFVNAFPVSISDMELDATVGDAGLLTFEAAFAYDRFEMRDRMASTTA